MQVIHAKTSRQCGVATKKKCFIGETLGTFFSTTGSAWKLLTKFVFVTFNPVNPPNLKQNQVRALKQG